MTPETKNDPILISFQLVYMIPENSALLRSSFHGIFIGIGLRQLSEIIQRSIRSELQYDVPKIIIVIRIDLDTVRQNVFFVKTPSGHQ